MSEIEITLPTVQFGNVKIRGTAEEWGLDTIADAPDVGVWAATYLNLFTQGFKYGATLDVDAHLGGREEAPPGDPQAAAARVADGRSPRTVDEANAMVAEVIKRELGATVVAVEDDPEAGYDAAYSAPNDGPEPAPWDSTVAAKPKPWENGGNKPAVVAEIDWS